MYHCITDDGLSVLASINNDTNPSPDETVIRVNVIKSRSENGENDKETTDLEKILNQS